MVVGGSVQLSAKFFYLLVFFCYLLKKTEDGVNATLVA